MSQTIPFDISLFVPGGFLPDDHIHRGTNDNTCSRCRWTVANDDVPLMLWINCDDMLIYCPTCLDGGPTLVDRGFLS